MEKDKIKKKTSELTKKRKKTCSKCKMTILSGEYYVRSILTGKIICSECDDNRVLIKGENFFSLD